MTQSDDVKNAVYPVIQKMTSDVDARFSQFVTEVETAIAGALAVPIPPPPPPAPVVADPNKIFRVVQQTHNMPDHDGSNAKNIIIDDSYGLIYCWPMTSLGAPIVVDANHLEYKWSHGDGQNFTFHKLATVKFVSDPLNPTPAPTPVPPVPVPPNPTPTPTPTPTPGPTSQVIIPLTMPPAGTSIKSGNLSVLITPDDVNITPFVLSGATPTHVFGNIQVPEIGFSLESVKTMSADGLWEVHFRSNADGKRCEIAILYGNAQNPLEKGFGGYTATFKAGTFVMGTVHAKLHNWLGKWRAATSDYVDLETPEEAAAGGWAPKFGKNDSTDMGTITPAKELDGPMAISDVQFYMGQTGGRLDLGYFHGRAASYYIGKDPKMRRSTRIWAEVSNAGGWHVQNPATGKYWDFVANPNSQIYQSESGKPPLYVMNKDSANPLFLEPDDGHHPNLSYPEFCLTLDPWHAQEVMHQALWYLGGEHGDGSPFHAILQKKYGTIKTMVVNPGQERGAAWVLRLLVCAYLASLRVVDETMPDSSFWKMALDRNRDVLIEYFVNYAGEARTSVFHTMPNQQINGSWQQDFWNQVMGIMEASGHFADWQPVFDYCRKNVQDRRDAASGADIEHPFWYYAICGVATFTPNPNNKGTITIGNIYHNGWVPIGPKTPTERGANTLVFTDATNFTLTTPSKEISKGVLNVEVGAHTDIGKHTGLNYTVTGSPQPGDGGTITLRELGSWVEFCAVNKAAGIFIDDWAQQADYVGDDLGAMLIFGQKHPDMAALAKNMIAEMVVKKTKQNPKYSYALAA